MSVYEQSTRRAFTLEIAGLECRYYSGAVAPPAKLVPDTTTTFRDLEAIVRVHQSRASLDPIGGVADYSPVRIQLASRGLDVTTLDDPGVALTRMGHAGAEWWAQVTETLTRTGAGPIYVDRDAATLGAPCLAHVGGEAVNVASVAGSQPDPDVADPYRLVLAAGGRGVASTQPLEHSVRLDAGDQPEVASEVVHWRTRRAVIYMADLRPDGSWSDLTEYVRGFVDSTPTVGRDGLSVEIDVVPLLGLLDRKLPEQASTRLVQGYHYFGVRERGFDPFDLRVSCLTHMQRLRRGTIWGGWTASHVSVAGKVYSTAATAGGTHAGLFDPAGLSAITVHAAHPRFGSIDTSGVPIRVDGLGVDGTGPYFSCPTVTAGQMQAGDRLAFAEARELHQVAIDDGLLEWPSGVLALLNAANGWRASSHLALAGQWIRLTVGRDPSGRAWVDLYPLYDAGLLEADACEVTFARLATYAARVGAYRGDGPRSAWRGTIGYDEGNHPPAYDFERWPGAMFQGPEPPIDLWYPIDFMDPAALNWTGYRTISLADVPSRIEIRGLALAFFQAGETHILVEDDVYTGWGDYTDLLVTYVDHVTYSERTTVVRVVDSDPVIDGGSTIGYRLQVSTDQESFGDWPHLARAEIKPITRYDSEPAHRVLLRLLESGGGDGTNGGLDTERIGADISEDDLDLASFYRFAPPGGLDEWRFTLAGDLTAGEHADPILRTVGRALVMRRDATGRSRISCSRLGPEDATSAVMALTDADFAGTPRNETDEDVRNRYAIALNYDDEDEAQVNVVVSDLRSQRTHGEARELSLELRGLRMEDSGANAPQRLLRPLYTRLMAMLGDPRRVWVVRVHAGVGLQLQLGDVVTVTSRYLRGSAWTAGGVAQVAARVVGITVDPVRETADLRLLHYGSAGTAWNASARVASVPAADEVVVEANIYADAEHPVTGEALEDLDGFQLGDVVRALPTGDHDMIGGGAAGLTITGINRLTRTITFDAPHGITMPTGGDIEPDSYDLAAAHHQVLAYLADAAGTLGAAAVAGQEAV